MTEQEFLDILYNPPKPLPVFFRLYYNTDGTPRCYTMEELEGTYIDITAEQFAVGDVNIRVVDGKIIPNPKPTPPKLKPVADSGTLCHPTDVAIIVNKDSTHQLWRKYTNESN